MSEDTLAEELGNRIDDLYYRYYYEIRTMWRNGKIEVETVNKMKECMICMYEILESVKNAYRNDEN